MISGHTVNPVIITTLMSFISGVFGTGLGGLLTVTFPKPSRGLLSGLLAFAGGIMFSMVAFDLVPAALKESGLFVTLLGLAGGMLLMLILDVIIPSKTSANRVQSSLSSTQHISHYKRMGILIALGIAIHNFAEGMAIGSGYVVTQGLGIGVAIVMAIHDVPEGVALAAPLRMGGVRAWKVLAISIGAGLPTAIGGLIGGLLGSISEIFLCICLSLSGGAMLSIVADQLLPDAKEANDGHTSNLGFGIGVILGIILTTVL